MMADKTVPTRGGAKAKQFRWSLAMVDLLNWKSDFNFLT